MLVEIAECVDGGDIEAGPGSGLGRGARRDAGHEHAPRHELMPIAVRRASLASHQEQMIEHGATRAADVQAFDERLRRTPAQTVGDQRCALRGLTGRGRNPWSAWNETPSTTPRSRCASSSRTRGPRAPRPESTTSCACGTATASAAYGLHGALDVRLPGDASGGGL